VEVSTLKHAAPIGMRGPTPLLRLQSDERLIVLIRRGNHAAFEALVARYQSRLLAFCRHMLGSREDAEDVLQEVFAASFNAILADERPINVRPWLYRIARNRSLNHLRRTQPIGVDSMDVHVSECGTTTADKVHKREEFRLLIADVQQLPESQKTALLLREIDALSYEQIAEAMETTIPSVKSLLVRARVSLAEASHARQLTCEDVREELGEVAEGLRRSTAPARRHVRTCDRCQGFKSQLRCTNRALAAVFPVAPLLLAKKVLLAHFGMSASAGASSAAGTAAAGVAATGGTSAMSAGISTVATKAAASLAAAAIVTAGAVEVKHVQTKSSARPAIATASPTTAAAATAPVGVASIDQPGTAVEPAKDKTKDKTAKGKPDAAATDVAATDSATPVGDTVDSGLAPVQEKSQSVIVTGTAGAPKRTVYRASPATAPPESVPAAPAAPEPPVAAPEEQPAEAPSTDPVAGGGYNQQP
jgi:RNA polymerase sigma factor (sigma-70 family)